QPGTLPEMPTGPSYQGPVCAPQCGDAHQCLPDGPCPGYATCLPTGPVGVAVTSVETTWNGSYVEWASCGDGIACYDPRYVRPGRYFARLCVTPGTLTVTDSFGPPTCTPTGAEECVDVAFDLPGPALVEVPLPPTTGG
ncbi:MAG TPA: hypothetical protein VN903_33335, partial [Polyangia bacterium]|nr:hypothetical protein [Polyangia bacterium]